MAKDNQSKRSDPGAAKTTKSKPGSNRPTHRKQWKKEHWLSYAQEQGIDTTGMDLKKVQSVLKELVKQGVLPNQNGGVRPNSGKKKTPQEHVQYAYELIAEHAMGEVEVKILDEENPGEVKKVKMTRVEALTAKLYSLGTKGNVQAINAYLDRFAGKAKQHVEFSGEIKTEEQNLTTPEEQAAAKAYEDALERGLPVKSPVRI